jgi:hypothetical protein
MYSKQKIDPISGARAGGANDSIERILCELIFDFEVLRIESFVKSMNVEFFEMRARITGVAKSLKSQRRQGSQHTCADQALFFIDHAWSRVVNGTADAGTELVCFDGERPTPKSEAYKFSKSCWLFASQLARPRIVAVEQSFKQIFHAPKAANQIS